MPRNRGKNDRKSYSEFEKLAVSIVWRPRELIGFLELAFGSCANCQTFYFSFLLFSVFLVINGGFSLCFKTKSSKGFCLSQK